MSTSQVAEPKHAANAHRGGPPKPLIVLLLLLIAGGSYWAYEKYFKPKPDETRLFVSGRIEGYEVNVGPKIGGKVEMVAYREGDAVKKGELIVKLADDDIQAQLRSARAKKDRATALAEQAAYQLKVVQSQIDEAKLRLTQSSEDTRAQIDQAEANVAQAQARLSEAQAQLTQSKSDLQLAAVRKQRYGFLASRGAVTDDENDQASTTFDTARAVVTAKESSVEAAVKQLNVSKANLASARTTRLNPGMREAQLQALNGQLAQARFQLASAKEDVASAQADEEQIMANIAYLNILSPIDGIVTARSVEPGAVVVAGQTVLSLINLDTVYMRAYVPEGRIGQVRVGERATVTLDSSPTKPFSGSVIQIDPEGSFTPENIYFKDDRMRQVFGIKIGINQPDRFAKPGMPADAEILLDDVGGSKVGSDGAK